MSLPKLLSFKELLAVDYTGTGDPQLAQNAKRRKGDSTSGTTEDYDNVDGEPDLTEEELKLIDTIDEKSLTPAERARKKQIMRRNKAKIALGQMIAKRRLATKQVIQKRAKRRARGLVMKKLLKGRNKQDLSYSARAGYEKMLKSRQATTDRLTIKMRAAAKRDDVLKLRKKNKGK